MSLLDIVSGLAVRYLDERKLHSLRSAYFSARTKLHPVLRARYGTFDVLTLRAHLEQRIGTDFEILMVHGSLNHMLPMFTDGPLDLVRMLADYCGPQRTLAMPAFYFGETSIGGAYATFKQRPRFDLRRTASQMGLVTELFRRWPGVVQSRHPIYRVSALGPLAAELTAGHETAFYGTGRGTPFEFMAAHDTVVIGLGKAIDVLTQAHHCEAIMGNEFPAPREPGDPLQVTIVDGRDEFQVMLNSVGVVGRFNIWKLRGIMQPTQLREWKFHNVPMFAARAADVTNALVAAAHRGVTLYDPL